MSLHLFLRTVVGACLSVFEVGWDVGVIAPRGALRAIAGYDIYPSAALVRIGDRLAMLDKTTISPLCVLG